MESVPRDLDRQLESMYGDLSTELLVARTRWLHILMEHCDDDKALDDQALEGIRQNIRERALAGNERYWGVNQQLYVLEREIESLTKEIFEVQLKQAENAAGSTQAKGSY